MTDNNPFALAARAASGGASAGPRAAVVAREYTPEQQREKLRGYVKVPPELYPYIDPGIHVRYYTKNKQKSNGFKIGGYVVNLTPGPPDQPPVGVYLNNVLGGTGTGWPVKFANVERIYAKMGLAWHLARKNSVSLAAFRTFGEQANERFMQLDARLKALERR